MYQKYIWISSGTLRVPSTTITAAILGTRACAVASVPSSVPKITARMSASRRDSDRQRKPGEQQIAVRPDGRPVELT